MRFLVMGAGSIGSVVGGLLYEGGNEVYLIGKGPHVESVMRGGLTLTGIWGDHHIKGIPAGTSIEELIIDGFEPEWTLLSVKSYDTAAALADLRPVLEGQRGIISLQNGIGNMEAMADAAPGMAVGGRVIFGAATEGPGEVRVTVCADDVLLGSVPGGPSGVREVCGVFADSGIPCRYEPEIVSYIWDKVLYNVCLNALASLLGTDYGSLVDDPHSSALIEGLVSEFYAVASAENIRLVSPNPESYLLRFREALLPPTRNHRSSMQEDIEMGRRTEIDSLNGAVWRLGVEHGIETPINGTLTRMIKFLEPC